MGVTGTSYTIIGLTNFQSYNVSVSAVNGTTGGPTASATVNLSPGTTWGYNIYNNSKYAVNVRPGPAVSGTPLGSFPANSGAGVQVICQVTGGSYQDPTTIPSGNLWDKIVYGSGGYVADGYVTTPNSLNNTFSPPIWPCS